MHTLAYDNAKIRTIREVTKFIFATLLKSRIFAIGITNLAMTTKQAIQLFDEKQARTMWDNEQQKWYYSVVNTVAVLTDCKDRPTACKYSNKLKHILKEGGIGTVTNCRQFKSTKNISEARNPEPFVEHATCARRMSANSVVISLNPKDVLQLEKK